MRRVAVWVLLPVLLPVLLAAAFKAGEWYAILAYQDRCLDMGGGRHPAGYAVCAVEVPAPD